MLSMTGALWVMPTYRISSAPQSGSCHAGNGTLTSFPTESVPCFRTLR